MVTKSHASNESHVYSTRRSVSTLDRLSVGKRQLLKRGISEETVRHFEITEHRNGWLYPVAPGTTEQRRKKFAGAKPPKYSWYPHKPQDTPLYDPSGELASYVHDAEGELWLCTGEADVWAVWEAGIRNATCLLQSENAHIPKRLVKQLRDMGVQRVHIAPDRDDAGAIFAKKVSSAFKDTSIELIVHQLPYPEDSKADIGKWFEDIGPEQFGSKLAQLPRVDLPTTNENNRSHIASRSSSHRDNLHERWAIDVVEREACHKWQIAAPDEKGFSRSLFLCPFHDDHIPSASWNYRTHAINCFACGSHNTKEVAEYLQTQSWDEFKAQNVEHVVSHAAYEDPDESQIPTWPYVVDRQGRMVFLTVNLKTGEVVPTPIADFNVRITTEIVSENGDTTFQLQGVTVSGRKIAATINARDMEDLNRLKATLSAASGPQGTIYPRMAQHLAPAIRKLSKDCKQISRYERTGWTNGKFLMPGRDLNGVELRLPSKLAYRTNPNADLSLGLAALQDLIRSVGPQASLLALIPFFQAPLAFGAGWRNERYVTAIQGRTGTFKTSFSQLAMALYGPDFATRDDLLIKWGEGATRNSIMAMATHAHDLPMLIDNYKPNTGDGASGFINLIHNLVEGGEKERLNSDSQLNESKSVFAWPIITGEDIPDNDPATVARLLIVRFENLPENASEMLSRAQANAEHLCAVGQSWIEFLESLHGQLIIQTTLYGYDDLRSSYLGQLTDIRKDAVNTRRVATNLATNETTWKVLLQHPEIGPVLSKFDSDYETGRTKVLATMANTTAESLAANEYIRAIRELVTTGRYRIEDPKEPSSPYDFDRILGYNAPRGGVHLLPTIARNAVDALLKPRGLGGISPTALYKQLDDLGFIASKGRNETVKTVTIHGSSVCVLHLTDEAVLGTN